MSILAIFIIGGWVGWSIWDWWTDRKVIEACKKILREASK